MADAISRRAVDSLHMDERKPASRAGRPSLRRTPVEVQIHSDTVGILTLRGEHDLSTARAIGVALATEARLNILIDLSGATFIDLSVINAILRSAQDNAGSIELVATSPSVPHRMLELTGIHRLLRVHQDIAAGLASMDACARSGVGDVQA